jgi:hypothetical protein
MVVAKVKGKTNGSARRLFVDASDFTPVIRHLAAWGFGVAVLAVAAIYIHANSNESLQDQNVESTIAVAAVESTREIELGSFNCLSTGKDLSSIFERPYFDDPAVIALIKEHYPGKRITTDNTDCSFGIGFTIIKTVTRAVQYHGRSSEVLMSFHLCTRKPSGQFNDRPCNSKNLYLFTNRVTPLQAFSLGLQAFIRNQDTKWTVMKLSTASTRQQ